jgi:hypothetical protein
MVQLIKSFLLNVEVSNILSFERYKNEQF